MKKLVVVLLVVAAALFATASAVAASGSDVAKGHGTTFFGDPFDFSATASFSDVGARGSVRLDTAPGATEYTFYGNVTCLRVVGNLAVIGASVTNISPPVAAFGTVRSVLLWASDGGKFGSTPDTMTWVSSSSPAPPDGACPGPLAAPPISSGDIVISDAIS